MTAVTTDQRQASLETVDAFFAAFGSGDQTALLNLFADEVDFRINGAPNVPWSGKRAGREEIAEVFNLFGQHLTGPDFFEVSGRIADGHDVVIFASCGFGVLSTGKKFANSYALRFTVVGGQIVRYHMYEDSYAISEAFTA